MIKPHLTAAVVLSTLAFAGLGLGAAVAQDAAPPPPAPEQTCGGLLCDAGIISGRRDPAFGPESSCGFFCRITGGGPAADAAAAQQAQAQAQAQADAAAAAEPKKPAHHKAKRKHVAKASPKAEPAAAESAPAAK